MKQKLRLGLVLLVLLGSSGRLLGSGISSVQFAQNPVTYNFESWRGMPISTNVNAAIGSKGREPATFMAPVDDWNLPNTPIQRPLDRHALHTVCGGKHGHQSAD
jgi:hypothetical protein